MDDNARLDDALALLAANSTEPEDFFDGVWQRVGQIQERVERRHRLALFGGLFVVGLGSGFGVVRGPSVADPAPYELIVTDQLSPSALLHVEP